MSQVSQEAFGELTKTVFEFHTIPLVRTTYCCHRCEEGFRSLAVAD